MGVARSALSSASCTGSTDAEAMHLEAADFENRQLGKGAHLLAVVRSRNSSTAPRAATFLVSGFAPGKHQRGGHALQVPLEGAADGLVKVVDVEDQPAVGRGKGAQVAHVRVAAELG